VCYYCSSVIIEFDCGYLRHLLNLLFAPFPFLSRGSADVLCCSGVATTTPRTRVRAPYILGSFQLPSLSLSQPRRVGKIYLATPRQNQNCRPPRSKPQFLPAYGFSPTGDRNVTFQRFGNAASDQSTHFSLSLPLSLKFVWRQIQGNKAPSSISYNGIPHSDGNYDVFPFCCPSGDV
jgi:hypothetical protein